MRCETQHFVVSTLPRRRFRAIVAGILLIPLACIASSASQGMQRTLPATPPPATRPGAAAAADQANQVSGQANLAAQVAAQIVTQLDARFETKGIEYHSELSIGMVVIVCLLILYIFMMGVFDHRRDVEWIRAVSRSFEKPAGGGP